MSRLLGVAASIIGATALAFLLVTGASGGKDPHSAIRDAVTGKVKPATLKATVKKNGKTVTVTKTMPFLSSGIIASAKEAMELDRGEAADANGSVDLGSVDLGSAQGTVGCSKRDGKGNVRVNQDCSFRRQAEEEIAANPLDPKNLIAGQNDSRVGFNQCGIDWSIDGGKHWGDMIPPFRSHLNGPVAGHTIAGGAGTAHTYDAASDPTVAFDADGRAFFSCVVFDINSNASGIYVTMSPKGAGGAFYYNVPTSGSRFIAVEDNLGQTAAGDFVSHDKQFIVADSYKSSPNKNNVYVTWTVFHFDPKTFGVTQSPIFGSMSTDHAQTWSQPEEISGSSDSLCFFGNFFSNAYGEHKCNFDQGSDPVVLPNGNLVVPFDNENTQTDEAQQLAVVCRPSGDSVAGTAQLNCGVPVKVGDDISSSASVCDFGRGDEQCVSGAFIRTNPFPRSAVNKDTGTVYVTWQDYRNGEWDIQLTRSTDGGATWAPSVTVNPDTGLDHYFPAVDVGKKGNKELVAVSYYRSETGPPGGAMSDYVLSGGSWGDSPFDFRVVSPVFPPPDGAQAGFNGDYSGLVVVKGDEAHPIWSDTRNKDPFAPSNGVSNDEDVFTDSLGIPSGKAKAGVGKVGKN
jgi:hypothetical protein